MKDEFENILFVTDFYYPNPTSIGICVGKLVDELRVKGKKTTVICYNAGASKSKMIINGTEVYFIDQKFGDRIKQWANKKNNKIVKKILNMLGSIFIRAGQIIYFHWFRMSSVSVPLRYYFKIKKLYKNNKYDMICSSNAPFDGTLGTYWFKKKNPEIFWECYILDTFSNKGHTKYIPSYTNDKKGWQWEKKFFDKADRIINIRGDWAHYNKERYNIYKKKMCVTDVPLFDEKNFCSNNININKDDKVKMIYAGRLLEHLSSPEYLCELLIEISKYKECYVDFYASGDCENLIRKYEKYSNGRISYCGIISHEKLIEKYRDTDILISIGSKKADLTPSKIFEYISMGKKIIHIIKDDNDICIKSYMKYPKALLIDERDDFNSNINRMIEFINMEDKKIEIKKLKNDFIENTPSHTVDLMIRK